MPYRRLTRFVTDPFVNIAIVVAITVGGLGFPVFLELARLPWRPAHWSLHTRLTLFMTGVLIAGGWLARLANASRQRTACSFDTVRKRCFPFAPASKRVMPVSSTVTLSRGSCESQSADRAASAAGNEANG